MVQQFVMETKQELPMTLNGKEYLLDIEQAMKLGLLKEKDSRVRSWEEFKEKYRSGYGHFYELHSDKVLKTSSPISIGDQLTPHEAKAIAAFSKLLKLRRDWIGELEPDWMDSTTCKFIIGYIDNQIKVNVRNMSVRSFSFPTEQMAREFLETFRDLIEEAKILI